MVTHEKLVLLGAERLADILLEFCQNSRSLQKQLDMILAGDEEDSKKMTSLINAEISKIRNDTSFLDEDETEVLANHLDSLVVRILELQEKSVSQAIDCLQSVMALDGCLLERSKDDYNSLQDVLIEACRELGEMYELSNLPIGKIADVVFKIFMHDNYGLYTDVIDNFKDALGAGGLKYLRHIFEESAVDEKNLHTIQRGLDAVDACLVLTIDEENIEDVIYF